MKINSKQLEKAMDVGSLIPKERFEALHAGFKAQYPATKSFFDIPKKLILDVLGMSEEMVGIRFTFGITDRLNPNSLKLILIPCGTPSEYSQQTYPIISKKGYYDMDGNLHTVKDTVTWIANYVDYMASLSDAIEYRKITRGNFMGTNAIKQFVKDPRCAFVRFYMGLEEGIIKPTFVPMDISENAFQSIFFDTSKPCPPFCGPETVTCIATLAVEANTSLSKVELDAYRLYRDEELLNLEGGAMLSECYYFISPSMAFYISQMAEEQHILHKIYQEKITPFKNLLSKGQFYEAQLLLTETLFEWVATYEKQLVMVY